MYLFGGLGGCDKDAQVFDGRKWKKLARLPFKSGSGSCSYRNGKVRRRSKMHTAASAPPLPEPTSHAASNTARARRRAGL